jgi:hypothetical protein
MMQRFDELLPTGSRADMLATAGNTRLIVAERLRGAVGRWADVSVREAERTISIALEIGTEVLA